MKRNQLKIYSLLLCFALLFTVGCSQPASQEPSAPAEDPAAEVPESGMTAGTYETVCRGFYGDFDIAVTVSDSEILDIELGEYQETEAVGGVALRLMKDNILAANTAGVDLISGATVTTAAFRAAVIDSLRQANAPEALTAAPEQPAMQELAVETDVLVIGAGAAGFAAAISAAENGADVTLIEKQDIVGGSTIISAGIVYAALDESDVAPMVDYYMERAEQHADRELLTFYAENSIDTIAFLDSIGVHWMMNVPAGTAPQPRAHFSMYEDGTFMIGSALIEPLEEEARRLGVTILTGIKATELLMEEGVVKGARAVSKDTNYTFSSEAVVMATGGFDASETLKEQYMPVAAGDFPLSNKGNVGEGLLMGMDVGAATDFKNGAIGFQIVHGSLPNSGYNASAMFAPLYVQTDGTFVAPGKDYPINYTNMKKVGDDLFYGLYDATGADSAQPAIDRGYGYQADTVEALAEAAGMDAAKLQAAFNQGDDLVNAPFYAVEARPSTIGSMGGLLINTRAEVLAEADNQPIPGLYAAGEVANSAFYYQEYPSSGSSISIGLTYGREAGKNAAAWALGE
ncbi:FAD-dependent oxidoreductase [Anoxynatronum buryatiense]|uniref:Urocanate reductase n=1 Tax=Anoxynatronum buryatiense TaxID=489973 RepID=A0AA45WXP5_9CLOT|nr:FAD-dependent oxidoreductase [Anoxynatronum buryatiense]SMP65622.1 fumarate reductase flavoprotein subunit [Anoxynatronum buryatiense]